MEDLFEYHILDVSM